MSSWIELRSDTFTKPTTEMRQAIFDAEVGDDMVGEDPTVNRLETYCCELFQKPAAVLTTSGSQSNQLAIWSQCKPGDELLIGEQGHLANYEAGAPAALSGVSFRIVPGQGGKVDVPELQAVVRPHQQHHPRTRLICLENSTNVGGGLTYSLEHLQHVCTWSHEKGYRVHLDGARLLNACVSRGYSPAEITQYVDTVSLCFSKGLGCPMGSVLLGSAEVIQEARRGRKLLGGALRQSGIFAAAAQYALEHHVVRLAEDHANAQLFADLISKNPKIHLSSENIETNIVFFEVEPVWGTAGQLAEALKDRDVRMYDVGPQRLRAVTHLDVTREEIVAAGEVINELVS